MGIKKFKYYFRKPKSEIVKDLLIAFATTGLLVIAATSPYFVQNAWSAYKKWKKYSKRKIYDAFSSLNRRGYLQIEYKDRQMYISLTPEGKKYAGLFQIDSLKISRAKQWDKKWRLLLFDISETKRKYREALRGKLKELGFFAFQKSAWVHAFECSAEIDLLRTFFNLSSREMCLVISTRIENDGALKEFFKIE